MNRGPKGTGHPHNNTHHNPNPNANKFFQGIQQGGIVSHLLAMDHSSGGHLHGHPQAQQAPPPRKPTPHGPLWLMALRSVDFRKALDGVTLSQNFLLLVLFLGFFGWLYVVYWIRHHESTDVNKFYNTGPVLSARIARDRQIVAGVKGAVPVRTTSDTGTVWTPGASIPVPPATAPQSTDTNQGYSTSQTSYGQNSYPVLNAAGAAVAAHQQFVDPRFGAPNDTSTNSSFGSTNVAQPIYADVSGASATVSLPPAQLPTQPAYNPVRMGQSDDGSRLKMFVNR
jgi:hypothetical protein